MSPQNGGSSKSRLGDMATKMQVHNAEEQAWQKAKEERQRQEEQDQQDEKAEWQEQERLLRELQSTTVTLDHAALQRLFNDVGHRECREYCRLERLTTRGFFATEEINLEFVADGGDYLRTSLQKGLKAYLETLNRLGAAGWEVCRSTNTTTSTGTCEKTGFEKGLLDFRARGHRRHKIRQQNNDVAQTQSIGGSVGVNFRPSPLILTEGKDPRAKHFQTSTGFHFCLSGSGFAGRFFPALRMRGGGVDRPASANHSSS